MKKKDKKKAPPLYSTHPIALSEAGSAPAEADAIKMAKKWVDENKL